MWKCATNRNCTIAKSNYKSIEENDKREFYRRELLRPLEVTISLVSLLLKCIWSSSPDFLRINIFKGNFPTVASNFKNYGFNIED